MNRDPQIYYQQPIFQQPQMTNHQAQIQQSSVASGFNLYDPMSDSLNSSQHAGLLMNCGQQTSEIQTPLIPYKVQ